MLAYKFNMSRGIGRQPILIQDFSTHECLNIFERRLNQKILPTIQWKAIYIGIQMPRKESSDKSSNALKEVLKHHHWRTIFFLKMVLESHHDRPRSLSLMVGDKKAYFTICFSFEKNNSNSWRSNCRRYIWPTLAIYSLQRF